MPESSVAGEDARNNSDTLVAGDLLEVRMDLTDDLLHMVHFMKSPKRNCHFLVG